MWRGGRRLGGTRGGRGQDQSSELEVVRQTRLESEQLHQQNADCQPQEQRRPPPPSKGSSGDAGERQGTDARLLHLVLLGSEYEQLGTVGQGLVVDAHAQLVA